MDELLMEAFRYNRWANLHLLDVCAKLSDEQLQLTAPGTYGTIAATFLHLAAAEQRYVRRLTPGTKPDINEDDPTPPSLAMLRDRAARSGDQLVEAAARITPDDTNDVEWNGGQKLHLWVVLVQAMHHGNDHRTHICTILGAHDIPYGAMDVWAYGEATGGIVPLASS